MPGGCRWRKQTSVVSPITLEDSLPISLRHPSIGNASDAHRTNFRDAISYNHRTVNGKSPAGDPRDRWPILGRWSETGSDILCWLEIASDIPWSQNEHRLMSSKVRFLFICTMSSDDWSVYHRSTNKFINECRTMWQKRVRDWRTSITRRSLQFFSR